VDLHFPETLHTKPARRRDILNDVNFEDSESIKVTPAVVDLFEEGTRLRLALPREKGAVLIVDTAGIPADALDALRKIAVSRLRQRGSLKVQYGTAPASWCRCRLTPSSGQLYTVVRLEATLFWQSGASAFPAGLPQGKAKVYPDYNLLAEAFPDEEREQVDHTQLWTPQDFYESVHVPEKDRDTKGDFETVLETSLYPFQKRAVHWMLRREGMQYEDGKLQKLFSSSKHDEVEYSKVYQDLNGQECYANHLQGIIQRSAPDGRDTRLSGGILAEEMGLGKTVEVMALLSLNRRPEPLPRPYHDEVARLDVTPSRATLIITPNSILQQWKAELSHHAPALKVLHYTGLSPKKMRGLTIKEMATEYDVVLTTYSVIGQELHFAEDPPERNMRKKPKHERQRSPLVQLQWWRICLDEAQMVDSGVTKPARVARRLPRIHSWAVSGTPLRKNIEDLHGLLIFLGYQPLSDDAKLWSHLITNHRHLFRQIFGTIALRHTKAQIREDLHLPQQKRVVITIPFSTVEQQNYSTTFTEMCEAVGVDGDGAPKNDGWDPQDQDTVDEMRAGLVRLRQSCLHPQIGKKRLGRGTGPIRTVAEVLDVMIDQNETELRVEERTLLNTALLRGHMLGNNSEDERRSENALEIYLAAMQRSGELVQDARKKLTTVKQMQVEEGGGAEETDDEDSSSESTPVLGRLRNNLRTSLQLQHACTFFAATAYFQIKTNIDITEPDTERFRYLEERETELYESAKSLRKEILKDNSRKAETLMRRITNLVENDAFTKMPKIKDLESLGGIESRRIVEKSDELFDKIREQARVVTEWRAKMAEYLLKPLVDKDEGIETTGDEYEDSTKLQDELYPYFDAVKAMQADINTFVTGETAPLIDFEVKFAMRAAKTYLDKEIVDDMKGMVHAPELTLKLLGVREKLRGPKNDFTSIRGLIQEARGLESSLHGYGGTVRAAERVIARRHLDALQATLAAYTKALASLEKEIDLFRSTQNQRLEFYRQLQEVSDAVEPYKEELDDKLDVERFQGLIERENAEAATLRERRTRSTFLLSLKEDADRQYRQRDCVICQCAFEHGVMTVCGHTYCKECLQHWLRNNPKHRTCPQCRQNIKKGDLHNVTYRPQQLKGREEAASGTSSPSDTSLSPSRNDSIYSDVDPQLLQEIKAIDLPTSYGTKIDTLGKHLLWIREHDPGAKSIVFSQYRRFLDVLGTALENFKIGYARLGRGGALEKFKRDPSIDCLLLDAKQDSSGMTLVNATHVFICEPLIQTAVELQAIARVHRIGQTRPTTIWMYLINDTVEEAIYDISVARRLAYVQARQSNRVQKSRSATPAPLQENAIDAANSEQLQSAPLTTLLVKGKEGGELVGKDDLWQCLFGKTQKDTTQSSIEEVPEVARHFRAEAAVRRRAEAMEVD
jgi:E3 ubiquitin-protein ligase SHPRH